MRPDDVVVVIPTLNECDHIETCIRSLASDPFARAVPILVADGGSDDGTRQIVRDLAPEFPNLALIANPDRLQSAGLNAAVAATERDQSLMVRCDAHARYPEGYVRDVAASLAARPDAASVCSVLDSEGDTCFARAAAWIVDLRLGSGGSAHRGGDASRWVDHAHHAGLRLDWFRRVGGYDPGFSHNEDAELDVRLGQAGGRIWLDATLRVGYHVRSSPGALARQYWNYGRGRARTLLKHRIRPRARQVIPPANFAVIVLCLLAASVLPIALAVPFAYLSLLLGVSAGGVVAMRSPCGLWAGPALGLMHNAWGAGFLVQLARSATWPRSRGPVSAP
ncbi:glycosyltransferase family 2 protein [Jannaschia sp. W003]|uniref:glycosyltransferase family 2 protein n=1 Tax=Jannaschia sp. W003 TaxID=2867012 RepID=UPI0021A25CDB|nr:glycosyltransferase family 2 protein [Jannaschia sp. W003]UWQ21592.1 glycosyltransferase family 2 protein [Jannaschia sp. W003]